MLSLLRFLRLQKTSITDFTLDGSAVKACLLHLKSLVVYLQHEEKEKTNDFTLLKIREVFCFVLLFIFLDLAQCLACHAK